MSRPLIVIGLDGAGFNVLDPLMARGELPHIKALCDSGWRTELLSTLPVATLPAWTSFLTAAHPAEHGVTDILVRGPGYGLVPANGRLRTLPTFLQTLSNQGLQVASLGVPGTFPPEPVNGICVAGFDAPGARQAGPEAVWPRSFYPQLRRLGGWRYGTFNEHGAGRKQAVAALLADLQIKERIILHTLAARPWDVFFVHLQASDTAAHHLWHTFDVNSPRHTPQVDGPSADDLPKIYRRLDALIGRLRAAAAPHARFLLVSDHGMGGAAGFAVHLNRWLHGQDLLQFAPRQALRQAGGALLRRALARLPTGALGLAMQRLPARALGTLIQCARGAAVNYGRSAAFSDELDYAPAIWINRAGVFGRGQVAPDAAERLSRQLQERLLAWRTPHGPVVARVHRRDQLPYGRHAGNLPDLLIEPAWPAGYRPSFLPSPGPGPAVRPLRRDELSAPKGAGMPGVHRREGVFIASGPGLSAMELPPMHIHQAGAWVYLLAEAGLPAAAAAHVPAYLRDLLQHTADDAGDAAAAVANPYAEGHSLALTQRLAHMGYL